MRAEVEKAKPFVVIELLLILVESTVFVENCSYVADKTFKLFACSVRNVLWADGKRVFIDKIAIISG